jgi:hypothetical protein
MSSSSNSSSPYRAAAERNIDLFESVLEKEREAMNQAVFAQDIGSKMRVPKRITLTGTLMKPDDACSLIEKIKNDCIVSVSNCPSINSLTDNLEPYFCT